MKVQRFLSFMIPIWLSAGGGRLSLNLVIIVFIQIEEIPHCLVSVFLSPSTFTHRYICASANSETVHLKLRLSRIIPIKVTGHLQFDAGMVEAR